MSKNLKLTKPDELVTADGMKKVVVREVSFTTTIELYFWSKDRKGWVAVYVVTIPLTPDRVEQG